MNQTPPDISWIDIDGADRTVLLFTVKQKWIYVNAMTEIDGWLTCCMKTGAYGGYFMSLDRFKIDATHFGKWSMEWLQDDWDGRPSGVAYPIPYVAGARFCNPLTFYEAFGEYRDTQIDAWKIWWDIIWAAQQSEDKEICQPYYCKSFRWKLCDQNRELFDKLWDASSPRGYVTSDALIEGRTAMWLQMWKAQVKEEERKRGELIIQQRYAEQYKRESARCLRVLRKRPIKVNPMEMMIYAGLQNSKD